MFRTIPYLTVVFLLGCQSKRAAIQIICNAPTQCTQCLQAKDPAERQTLLVDHIRKNLRNREVIEQFDKIANPQSAPSTSSLADYIKSAGVESCPLTDPVKLIEVENVTLPQQE